MEQLTKKTGKEDDEACTLCGETETNDHIWYCGMLAEKRGQLDEQLAEADPEDFTPAMRMGVACALNADPRRTYWGRACDDGWCQQKKRSYGCVSAGKLKEDVKGIMDMIDETDGADEFTAREIMTALTRKKVDEEDVIPRIEKRIEEEAPREPNVYSDGSLKNIKGPFWHLGGAGVWWPGRKEDQLTRNEGRIAEYKECEGGLMLWCTFNSSLNSSTRCELAAAIVALLAPRPANIAIDNATVVRKGNEIIDHARRKEEEERSRDSRMILGGSKSGLHRESPYKKKWSQIKDGDLWELFANLVKQRGPKSVRITKVKGHATKEMVEEGRVKAIDKEGNDKADEAAEMGATTGQGKLRSLAEIYSWRHAMYRKLMARIQKFIVELKKEEKKQKQEDDKAKDPFGRKEATKVEVPLSLRYAKEEEAERISMHEVRKQWCKDEEEWTYVKGVQEVLRSVEWKKS